MIIKNIVKAPGALMHTITSTNDMGGEALRQMATTHDSGGAAGGGSFASEGGRGIAMANTVATHLEAEAALDLEAHEIRLAEVLFLLSGNFALGVRMMIFTLPLLVGLFDDVAILVMSALTMLVLYYFDSLV
jgi:hypothetical protein